MDARAEEAAEGGGVPTDTQWDEDAVEALKDLIRIRTISQEGPHSGAYAEAAQMLTRLAKDVVGLASVREVELVERKPIVLATWEGTEPHLPRILLNSHYDVVPVLPKHWSVDPFAAVEKEGNIYGRGVQDMKCVCVQYLAAIRRLRGAGFRPRRTVVLSFVPDEEIAGRDGMMKLLASEEWKAIEPVGLALDEGIANPGEDYTVFFGERSPWPVEIVATGPTGHGSRFIEGTATSKLVAMCNKALAFRREQEDTLDHTGGCSHASAKKLGDVTTVNINVLKAGVSVDGGKTFAFNTVPSEATAILDIRVAPTLPLDEFRAVLDEWCAEEGVSWKTMEQFPEPREHYVTSTDVENAPWWALFTNALQATGAGVSKEIFPAGTDSRFLRKAGLPALGFSPMRRTPVLLHDHDERLHRDVFIEGIGAYERVIRALAGAPRFPSEPEGPAAAAAAAAAAGVEPAKRETPQKRPAEASPDGEGGTASADSKPSRRAPP